MALKPERFKLGSGYFDRFVIPKVAKGGKGEISWKRSITNKATQTSLNRRNWIRTYLFMTLIWNRKTINRTTIYFLLQNHDTEA